MTLGIRYAARSDVGMLREGNEDSAYAGSHLLAVADGMGGHVGGEIASAAAIEALRRLDKELPATELLASLERTVKSANDNLHRIVEGDPALQGMGTTLTAMLWAGNQIALVHIGDSRAYLLRDGSLFQITHDHTLVQSLVDEGRISPDEAASHPQRSLLLRALDGRGEVDPDLSLREAKVGDRYLLCSDGLSGVITAETIFQVLTDVADPDQAVRQLIDLANRGGGPDNITCVVADVVDLGQQPQPPMPGRSVGAAANAAAPPDMPGGGPGGQAAQVTAADTPAGRAAQLRDTMPQPPVAVDEMPPPAPAPANDPMGPPPQGAMAQPATRRERRAMRGGGGARRWTWLIVAVGVIIIGLVAGGFFTVQQLRGGYYVGQENGKVVVYRGTNQKIPLIDLSRKADAKDQPSPAIMVADLPANKQQDVRDTFPVSSARKGIEDLKSQVCKFSLRNESGKVIIKKGEGQANCQVTKVQDSAIRLEELPGPDADGVQHGSFTFIGLKGATDKLNELGAHKEQCKNGDPSVRGCPAGSKGGSHG
ncbi:serine/threonine-protein phosphatase [Actinomadura barringtoniae]|uniref:Serine/threonine protein phosphatase PstP n=1 Tax=Actinomadura barringtoniae TaxID=1427535 RepID=A0A939PNS6_9ACTN|nr:protein phosphatase 2C domain-containing protein [Actinomadura barringtoniae]MBO2453468.1 serine/threonine-protein phosphatase [Actinomadura barringtoniae]